MGSRGVIFFLLSGVGTWAAVACVACPGEDSTDDHGQHALTVDRRRREAELIYREAV
jgi:hypothetical protein